MIMRQSDKTKQTELMFSIFSAIALIILATQKFGVIPISSEWGLSLVLIPATMVILFGNIKFTTVIATIWFGMRLVHPTQYINISTPILAFCNTVGFMVGAAILFQYMKKIYPHHLSNVYVLMIFSILIKNFVVDLLYLLFINPGGVLSASLATNFLIELVLEWMLCICFVSIFLKHMHQVYQTMLQRGKTKISKGSE